MLHFFRKYQRYFFLMTTIVIVISFSFFGTFSALSDNPFREQIAFTAVDGRTVTRHELDEMVAFLATDADDKQFFGGSWGPNFLNDGVIKKNFLATGLGVMLATAYPDDIKHDLEPRIDKERRYALYTHPQARFIGVESAWNYFTPEMTKHFTTLRSFNDPSTPQAFETRTTLFLMERQLPSTLLHRVLRSQEAQYSWLTPDRNLDYIDLSLFGYHTVEDWFGPRFVRLAAEFVINAAIIAEQRGYQVSKADAMADLIRNADVSFRQNLNNPKLGVTSSQEYFSEQLRRLGSDHNMAVKTWQQVLLFRRLFQDMGGSVFVDPHTFAMFDAYALASADGQIYRLPKELQINNYRTLQKLETYLNAVSKRSEDEKAKLKLPTTFLSAAEVVKTTPTLVQKRYLLEIAQVNKKSLESNIAVKDTWNWEVETTNWELLKKQFPELGLKPSTTKEERYAILDALDDKTRGRIDTFARTSIVNEHPEWLETALAAAPQSRQVVGLHEKGTNAPFNGLDNGKKLMELLDASDKVPNFTADNKTYYRISVIDREKEPEVMTFAEANQQGILDTILDNNLETYYAKIRDAAPKEFQKDDKSWKAFDDVKDAVADRYFEKILRSIRTQYAAAIAPEKAPEQMIPDFAASVRLFPYVQEVKNAIEKNPSTTSQWIRTPIAKNDNPNVLPKQMKLNDQWKMEMADYQTTRSGFNTLVDKTEIFALNPGGWTKVNAPANGDLNFFQLKEKGKPVASKSNIQSVSKARLLLSDNAQQHLMESLLKLMGTKNAISLEYLNQTTTQSEG